MPTQDLTDELNCSLPVYETSLVNGMKPEIFWHSTCKFCRIGVQAPLVSTSASRVARNVTVREPRKGRATSRPSHAFEFLAVNARSPVWRWTHGPVENSSASTEATWPVCQPRWFRRTQLFELFSLVAADQQWTPCIDAPLRAKKHGLRIAIYGGI